MGVGKDHISLLGRASPADCAGGTPTIPGGMGAVRIRSGSAWKNRVSLRRILSRLGKAQTSLALRSLLQNLPPTKRGCTRNANGLGDCTGGGRASPAGCAGETPTTSAKAL